MLRVCMDASRPVDEPTDGKAKKGAVLLLVDVINPLTFPEARQMEPALRKMARQLRTFKSLLSQQGVICVYANDHYGAWRSDFRDVKERCAGLGGVSAWMTELLAPDPDDYVVLKPRHSAFYGTPLELLLTHLRCRDLIVCGLSTDMCVQMTAVDAYLRGFRLWVPRDCSVAASPALHRQALAYMERVVHARTDTADEGQAHRLLNGGLPSKRRSP